MLPLLYHAHHNRHLEDLLFWLKLAEMQGGPILELGCGTGRVLIPLAQAGYHVFGLDNDLAMLSLLRANLAALESPPAHRPTVFQADLCAFHLAESFQLILLPCNTWSTLEGAERRAALRCIREHLRPGGLFAVSLPNPEAFFELPNRGEAEVEEEFEHPLTGATVQVSSAWERTGEHFVVSWHYDHLLPRGGARRMTAQARHTLDSAETYQGEIRDANLEVVACYGDFDGAVYLPTAPNLILLARRG